MPVSEQVASVATLFLWCPAPLLKDGLEVTLARYPGLKIFRFPCGSRAFRRLTL